MAPRRLLDASREVRILALKQIPALIAQLTREAKAALRTIEEAEKLVQ